MNGKTRLMSTISGSVVFGLACTTFAVMYWLGFSRAGLSIPLAVGWAAALVALRPLVREEKHGALYFAFGVLALFLFFLHQTYGYTGRVRIFPLLVGYTGVFLSILDILSLTETRIARRLNAFFGSALAEDHAEGRRVSREIAVFAAMIGGVVLVYLFGFLIAAPVFVFLWMWLWGGKAVKSALYGGVFTFLFIWVMFEQLLQYSLYRGLVVVWVLEAWAA